MLAWGDAPEGKIEVADSRDNLIEGRQPMFDFCGMRANFTKNEREG
jgi:hypothetical protein